MDMSYITKDSAEIMRWFAWLKVIFMWFGVLCAILIPLLIIAYKKMEEWGLPMVVEKIPSPNGKIVAIVADRDISFSGSIMRFIYIGPSHLDYPKNREHFRLAMQGDSFSLQWENSRVLTINRYHDSGIDSFNPKIQLSDEPNDFIFVKLNSSDSHLTELIYSRISKTLGKYNEN